MSIKVMSHVWDDSQHGGGKLLVLLALADFANDSGICWPSVDTLASKARLSERQTQRVLRELEESGEVEIWTGGFTHGKKKSSTYKVRPDNMSRPPQTSEDADADDRNRVTPTPPEPSVEPSEEPSTALAAGAAADDGLHLPGMAPDPAPVDAAPSERDAIADRVWAHYLGVFGEKLRVKELTKPRRRALLKGLAAIGDDERTAMLAIDGLKSYRTAHPTGSDDTSLGVVFATGPQSRSSLTDQIEWWADQADNTSAILPSVPSVLHERVTRKRVQVVEMLANPGSPGVRERGEEAVQWLRTHAKEEPVIEGDKVIEWRRVA